MFFFFVHHLSIALLYFISLLHLSFLGQSAVASQATVWSRLGSFCWDWWSKPSVPATLPTGNNRSNLCYQFALITVYLWESLFLFIIIYPNVFPSFILSINLLWNDTDYQPWWTYFWEELHAHYFKHLWNTSRNWLL